LFHADAAKEVNVDDQHFLLGVPVSLVKTAYAGAPGNEIESGKFASPESSAALVANTFGLFVEHSTALPALPGTVDCGWPAESVMVEHEVRFPWPGGMHPWLDVLIVTGNALIGVESKRYEPFRSHDEGCFSDAYWRPVWGTKMTGYECCRDEIRDYGGARFARLDAAQLVKHALALRTAVQRRDKIAWLGKRPILFYLYAEPWRWPGDKGAIPLQDRLQHRAEVQAFTDMVAEDEVSFRSCSYSELLAHWAARPNPVITAHAAEIAQRFLV
jgi:hypothetical protein